MGSANQDSIPTPKFRQSFFLSPFLLLSFSNYKLSLSARIWCYSRCLKFPLEFGIEFVLCGFLLRFFPPIPFCLLFVLGGFSAGGVRNELPAWVELRSGVPNSSWLFSEMFDWEDQEIANIIWGEADDNTVTYPEESEKKSQSVPEDHDKSEANEDAEKSKPSEQKSAATKTKLPGDKLERNDELSILASNSDLNSIGKKTDRDKDPEISENQDENGGLGDIIGNSWANIESFDDLDHIFSNDELVDHASLDSTDEFWASSRDVLDNAVNSSCLALDSTNWGFEALGNSSGEFNYNSEYMHTENQSYGSTYEKEADSACYTQKMLHSRFDEEEIDDATDPNLISDKTAAGMNGKNESEPKIAPRNVASVNKSSNMNNWSRPQLKHELKSQKINNHRRLCDAHGAWAPPAIVPAIDAQQFDAKYVPNTARNYVSSVLDHQKMPQQSTSLAYQQLINPYSATYSYGNISDQCTAMSMLPATDDGRRPVLNAEAGLREKNYTGKSINAPIKPPKMTPQEKIEKLRRRQQIRAMLAIQKQQQQFSHQVPVDYIIPQMSSQEGDQVVHLERGDCKGEENIVPTYDPSSPLKQDDSSSISVEVDDQNVEDTILYQLQNTVTKLDMNIRLCIRDSLFRLARSAMQRHSTNDSSSANRFGETNTAKEDTSNQESFMKLPSAETETNQIDRAVAHLLFHRPIKSSVKHIGTPESSITITPKITPAPEIGTSCNLPMNLVTKGSHNVQNISTHGSTTPCASKKDPSEQSNEDMIRNQKMKQKMVESAD
ncbi:hypothetical protein V2J09_012086 [Rumex salicifolius]